MKTPHIENINDYVRDLIEDGAEVISAKKTAIVQARQGTVGEVVTTDIDKTTNVVKLDDKTGKPGWVVTNPGGEEYIVSDSKFSELYEAADKPGEYAKKAIQLLVPCEKTVEFEPSWGGSFTVEAGGYFTINGYQKIAGIQKDAFEQTYMVVSQSQKDVDKALSVLNNEKQTEIDKAKVQTVNIGTAVLNESIATERMKAHSEMSVYNDKSGKSCFKGNWYMDGVVDKSSKSQFVNVAKTYGDYEFTDAECKALLNGESVTIKNFQTKMNGVMDITGKLVETLDKSSGKTFIGFERIDMDVQHTRSGLQIDMSVEHQNDEIVPK